jgi:hypothetical protein
VLLEEVEGGLLAGCFDFSRFDDFEVGVGVGVSRFWDRELVWRTC